MKSKKLSVATVIDRRYSRRMGRFLEIGLFLSVFILGADLSLAGLSSDRWAKLGEEERYQMTRAETNFQKKNFKAAKPDYEHFLQLYPKSDGAPYAQFMFAECTRQMGQINQAIKEFRDVIDYFPDSPDAPEAMYSMGLCQTQSGDQDAAILSFEKVIEKWPASSASVFARRDAVDIYWRFKNFDQAVECLKFIATGDYVVSDKRIRAAGMERYFSHLLYQNKISEAYELAGKLHKERGGKNNQNTPEHTFAVWLHDAVKPFPQLYPQDGEKKIKTIVTDSCAFLDQKTASQPPSKAGAETDLAMAQALLRVGLSEKATEKFLAMHKKYPDSDAIIEAYAKSLADAKKWGESREIYRSMQNKYRGDSCIAKTYVDEGKPEEAVEYLKKMLTKHSDQVKKIQYTLGDTLRDMKKYKDAIPAFEASQSEPQSLFAIAQCQSELGQHDAAIQTLTGVVNFFTDRAGEAMIGIAHQYAAKGDSKMAQQTLIKTEINYKGTTWAGRAHQELAHKYGMDVTKGGLEKIETE